RPRAPRSGKARSAWARRCAPCAAACWRGSRPSTPGSRRRRRCIRRARGRAGRSLPRPAGARASPKDWRASSFPASLGAALGGGGLGRALRLDLVAVEVAESLGGRVHLEQAGLGLALDVEVV